MRKHFFWVICVFSILSASVINWGFTTVKPLKTDSTMVKSTGRASSAKVLFSHFVNDIYLSAKLGATGLDSAVFQKALVGYYNLKISRQLPSESSVVTIVDFNKPSTTKRMWIVDVQKKKLLLNTWVAHGQGSGDNMANMFSNTAQSHQSSLGFYITSEIYQGKHGRSLRLDGVDAGFNDQARNRDIVVHGANYVCQNTINQLGRLGRSHGCPAVATDVIDEVISDIKDKNLLFINSNIGNYASKYLDEDKAATYAYNDSSFNLVKDIIGN